MLKLMENRKLEEAGKTNIDPNYCWFHQNLRHPTKEYYNLKNKIHALIEAGFLQLKEEQKKVFVNIETLMVGTN